MDAGEQCPQCKDGKLQPVENPENEKFELLCTHCGTGFNRYGN